MFWKIFHQLMIFFYYVWNKLFCSQVHYSVRQSFEMILWSFSLKIIAHIIFLETLIKHNKNQISMIFFLLFAYPQDQYYKYFTNNLHPSATLFLLLLSLEFLTIIFRFIISYLWIFTILYIWSQFLYLRFYGQYNPYQAENMLYLIQLYKYFYSHQFV